MIDDQNPKTTYGAGVTPRRRLFGRQKSHALSAAQQQLMDEVFPDLELNPDTIKGRQPLDLFKAEGVTEVWLEIGFGGGEHLIWQLAHNPNVGMIGCEPFLNGVAKCLAHLPAGHRPRLRLYKDDAYHVLHALPDGCLSRVFILFPDPWPKARHAKRRLVNSELLRTLARVMPEGAELRFATDINDYMRTALQAFMTSPHFDWTANTASHWRVRPADWPETRYERKAIAAGRNRIYLTLQRTAVRAPEPRD